VVINNYLTFIHRRINQEVELLEEHSSTRPQSIQKSC